MKKRGNMYYVPQVIIDEVIDLQREEQIEERPEAFKRLVGYARVGRELNRIKNLDFSRSLSLPSLGNYSDVPKKFNYKKRGIV